MTGQYVVRKRRAPKGALRQVADDRADLGVGRLVRKHRAPEGALRHEIEGVLILGDINGSESTERQTVH